MIEVIPLECGHTATFVTDAYGVEIPKPTQWWCGSCKRTVDVRNPDAPTASEIAAILEDGNEDDVGDPLKIDGIEEEEA